ncbi:hypothetical protein AVEN_230366-1 [Araneus ventricosus]|uniref:Uncharacterized protein n=1 Tax=Araneus ventricosus TaxID=182803 RepID=A0A4Y2IKD7_ARAVE|nr:hypothetical protein AVEN_230366-1 [Araneus ventricosus]
MEEQKTESNSVSNLMMCCIFCSKFGEIEAFLSQKKFKVEKSQSEHKSRDGLVVRSRLRIRKVLGSKPDSLKIRRVSGPVAR